MTRREAILLAVGASRSPAAPSQLDLFSAATHNYDTFRIPSLIPTARRSLLAFCEGRRNSRSDSGDIDIILRRSTDRGRSWSAPVTILDLGPDTVGNPCPVVDRKTGAIFLLLTSNPGHITEKQILDRSVPETRRVLLSTSTDDGLTWSKPADITATTKDPSWTWYATGPGVGIQLRTGRLLIPCDHADAGTRAYHSHCIYSDDHGRTWRRGERLAEKTNECQVAELRDGSVLLNMRSYHGHNRRAVARSRDGGVTWSDLSFDQTLVEPVCQASLIRAGNLLLFSNPASTRRENMTVRASRDDGRTWPLSLVLHAGPSAYSCLAPVSRNRFACLYERGDRSPYDRITLATFSLEALS